MAQEDTRPGTARSVEFDPFAGAAISASFPTTEPQKEVWLSSQLGPDASCSYNQSIVLELRGRLSVEALEAALNDVVRRHDALRAMVSADGESLLIADDLSISLPTVDLASLDPESAEAETRRLLTGEVTTPFDLLNGPLIRARLLRRSDDRDDLVVSAHHIVCDGWSFELLLGDLARFYNARQSGQDARLPNADSFQVYVQRHSDPGYADDIRTSEEYWLQRFRHVPPQTEFPPDLSRPKERSFEAHCLLHPLPISLVDDLRKLGSAHRCSLMTTLLCAFEVFVSRLTGLNELVIGVPSAGQLAFDCPGLVGHCVNLLPLRTHVEPSLSFAGYLDSRRTQILSDFDHQKFTYGSLIKSLRLKRDVSRMPLTSLMFNIDQPLKGIAFDGLELRIRSNPRQYDAFEQFFNLTMEDDEATIECQYNSNLFSEPLMRHRLESFQKLLEEIAQNADQRIDAIDLLSARQRNLVTSEWAGDAADEPATAASVYELVRGQAGKTPDNPAVSCAGQALTYAQLDASVAARSLALRQAGVGRGSVVGVHMARSIDLVATLLSVLRIGATYLPLDPGLPDERLRLICGDARLALLVTDDEERPGWLDDAAKTIRSETMTQASELAGTLEDVAVDPADAAYMIYTSGSTGKPKGVVVRHSNVVNFLLSMAREPGMVESDRLLAVTTCSFDISVLEFFLPLCVGAEVVIATNEETRDGKTLAELLEKRRITVLQSTPATWKLLLASGWKSGTGLKALCGGEAMPIELARELLPRVGALYNMYGPTETTVWSTVHRFEAEPRDKVPLGKPIRNTRLYVLDRNRRPVPPGTIGELCIGGRGVAAGYHDRAELTADKFADLPFRPEERIYATGDLVRFSGSGELYFEGRSDDQVKIRGYRVELGDIENALQQVESVSEAVVVVKQLSTDDHRLIAHVVPAKGTALSAAKLRKELRRVLPDYMIPQHIVEIAAMPLSPSGKIDRKALPDMELKGNRQSVDPPATETERQIAAIWKEAIGVNGIDRRDHFFELGGHSLLAMHVIAEIEQRMKVRIPVAALMLDSLQQIAAAIEGEDGSANAPTQKGATQKGVLESIRGWVAERAGGGL